MSASPAPAPTLAPDLEEARRFLAALASTPDDTKFTFQTFADNARRNDDDRAQVLHGTFDEHAQQLVELNARGAGVFVTVNRTNGRGRKATDIVGVRAVYADFDGIPRENADRLGLAPHITVESSPGRWHVYYRTLGVPLDRFEGIQTTLIKLFDSDPQVTGRERVMRLPGFLHQKDTGAPFVTRIVGVTDDHPYGLPDLPRGIEDSRSQEGEQPDNVVAMPLPEEREKALAMALEKARRTHDTSDGRKGPMRQLGFDLKAADISRPIANLAAKLYAKECRSTNSEGQPSPFLEKDALDLITNAYKPGKVVNPRDDESSEKRAREAAAVEDMNKKFALVLQGGSSLILRDRPGLAPDFIKLGAFKDYHANAFVGKRNKAQLWMSHPALSTPSASSSDPPKQKSPLPWVRPHWGRARDALADDRGAWEPAAA